jgi:hypothetical protein
LLSSLPSPLLLLPVLNMRARSPSSAAAAAPASADAPASPNALGLLLLLAASAADLNSSVGSGQSAEDECVMRLMRAVSGTLFTGRISLPRKALISVDLPAQHQWRVDKSTSKDTVQQQTSSSTWPES